MSTLDGVAPLTSLATVEVAPDDARRLAAPVLASLTIQAPDAFTSTYQRRAVARLARASARDARVTAQALYSPFRVTSTEEEAVRRGRLAPHEPDWVARDMQAWKARTVPVLYRRERDFAIDREVVRAVRSSPTRTLNLRQPPGPSNTSHLVPDSDPLPHAPRFPEPGIARVLARSPSTIEIARERAARAILDRRAAAAAMSAAVAEAARREAAHEAALRGSEYGGAAPRRLDDDDLDFALHQHRRGRPSSPGSPGVLAVAEEEKVGDGEKERETEVLVLTSDGATGGHGVDEAVSGVPSVFDPPAATRRVPTSPSTSPSPSPPSSSSSSASSSSPSSSSSSSSAIRPRPQSAVVLNLALTPRNDETLRVPPLAVAAPPSDPTTHPHRPSSAAPTTHGRPRSAVPSPSSRSRPVSGRSQSPSVAHGRSPSPTGRSPSPSGRSPSPPASILLPNVARLSPRTERFLPRRATQRPTIPGAHERNPPTAETLTLLSVQRRAPDPTRPEADFAVVDTFFASAGGAGGGSAGATLSRGPEASPLRGPAQPTTGTYRSPERAAALASPTESEVPSGFARKERRSRSPPRPHSTLSSGADAALALPPPDPLRLSEEEIEHVLRVHGPAMGAETMREWLLAHQAAHRIRATGRLPPSVARRSALAHTSASGSVDSTTGRRERAGSSGSSGSRGSRGSYGSSGGPEATHIARPTSSAAMSRVRTSRGSAARPGTSATLQDATRRSGARHALWATSSSSSMAGGGHEGVVRRDHPRGSPTQTSLRFDWERPRRDAPTLLVPLPRPLAAGAARSTSQARHAASTTSLSHFSPMGVGGSAGTVDPVGPLLVEVPLSQKDEFGAVLNPMTLGSRHPGAGGGPGLEPYSSVTGGGGTGGGAIGTAPSATTAGSAAAGALVAGRVLLAGKATDAAIAPGPGAYDFGNPWLKKPAYKEDPRDAFPTKRRAVKGR